MPRRLVALALGIAYGVARTRSARAEPPSRPPMPESLLTESATDVDAEEAGEVEYEANFATVGARVGGARATMASLEVEWRFLREAGVRLEPSFARVNDGGSATGRDVPGIGGALALGLFHDYPRDLHLQAELLGRTPESQNARVLEPGEPELPFAADLVSAGRWGRWTVRATVGAEAGGSYAHIPLHTDLAVLTGILPEERFGFLAIDVRADWAREAPLVIAPEVVADATPIGLPLRFGVALPANVGAAATQTSYGLFVRLILLTSREVEYGRASAVSPPSP